METPFDEKAPTVAGRGRVRGGADGWGPNLNTATLGTAPRSSRHAAGGRSTGADSLLSRLDRVRQSGRGRWTARCPAHDDRGPSLAVRELDDGRVLVHCFAGCGVDHVLGAVGLDVRDLFPERRIGDQVPRERKPYLLRELVAALRHEMTVGWVILAAVHQGRPIGEADRKRAGVAVDRILRFLEEAEHVA